MSYGLGTVVGWPGRQRLGSIGTSSVNAGRFGAGCCSPREPFVDQTIKLETEHAMSSIMLIHTANDMELVYVSCLCTRATSCVCQTFTVSHSLTLDS